MDVLGTPKLDTVNDRVAARIRGQLGERGASQAQLARALGVAAMWVSDRLSGKTAISLNDLGRIAEALGMEAVELIPRRVESDKRISARSKTRPPSAPHSGSTGPGHGNGPNSSTRTSRTW